MKPSETYRANRPRKGDRVAYNSPCYGWSAGIVTEVSGGICYYLPDGHEATTSFIWCFKEGLNKLHFWPAKDILARDK
jgi:hypothetical protein